MKPRLLDLFCGAGGAAMGYGNAVSSPVATLLGHAVAQALMAA